MSVYCMDCGVPPAVENNPFKYGWDYMRLVEDDDPDSAKLNGWRCPYCQKRLWKALNEKETG